MNDVEDLARRLQDVEDHADIHAPLKKAALDRTLTAYSWEGVITQYEDPF
jgi:hypothetical protein